AEVRVHVLVELPAVTGEVLDDALVARECELRHLGGRRCRVADQAHVPRHDGGGRETGGQRPGEPEPDGNGGSAPRRSRKTHLHSDSLRSHQACRGEGSASPWSLSTLSPVTTRDTEPPRHRRALSSHLKPSGGPPVGGPPLARRRLT